MPQETAFEIRNTAMRVYEISGGVLGNGVDGQIAPRQILLQGDLRRGVKHKAVITARSFALGARQRIFFMRHRMQENRKVLAHRLVAELDHLLGRGAYHHVVAIHHWQAEQLIAHGTADHVDLHRVSSGIRNELLPSPLPLSRWARRLERSEVARSGGKPCQLAARPA